MVQAGWHLPKTLVLPDNMTILPLPPRPPEFDRQENICLLRRDIWPASRPVNSCDDIVDHCSYA
ncbi:hypothetical protein PZ897_00015 [Hoeflea sp. YIM 152468]|uniref:hypothetical protein n=1 Tax=Hoeflea sp. YIM 152468 TaxID=3031759 RepID=UPI0023DA8432|nr:hypothetical protein [Hoeflea sp. YIM 152468]MDF1606551.1 hypothetical protein [Hoeflea sp. YIM 152468]